MIDLRDQRPEAPPEFRDSRPSSTQAHRAHARIVKARENLEARVAAGKKLRDKDFPGHGKPTRDRIAGA